MCHLYEQVHDTWCRRGTVEGIAPYHGAAGPNRRFYEARAAQELVVRHASELKIWMVPVEELHYAPRRGRYLSVAAIDGDGETTVDLGADELHRGLSAGEEIPGWFSYPEVIDELRYAYSPRGRHGPPVKTGAS